MGTLARAATAHAFRQQVLLEKAESELLTARELLTEKQLLLEMRRERRERRERERGRY